MRFHPGLTGLKECTFISCVVISQIVIEHTLAGLLNFFGRTDLEGAGFRKLAEEALSDGHISQKEFDDLNQLRRLRNPYSHSKPIMHRSCIMRRAAETGSHPLELFKEDAKTALAIVATLLSRRPFSLPDQEGSNETASTEPGGPADGGS